MATDFGLESEARHLVSMEPTATSLTRSNGCRQFQIHTRWNSGPGLQHCEPPRQKVRPGIQARSISATRSFPTIMETAIVGAGVSVGTNGVSVFEHGGNYVPSLLVYDTPIQTWTHVAVVYSNRQPALYLNGNLVRVGLVSSQDSNPSNVPRRRRFWIWVLRRTA